MAQPVSCKPPSKEGALGSEGIDEAASCMKLPWEVDATEGEGGGSLARSPLEEEGEPPCCPSALRQEVDAIGGEDEPSPLEEEGEPG